MREAFANRKQGETQPENEERETQNDKKSADDQRQKLGDGTLDDKDPKCADDNDDRQNITQAGERVLSKCNQRVFQFGRNLPRR